MFKKILTIFAAMLKTDSNVSVQRFGFLFTTIMSNISFWGVWLFLCLYRKELVDIPSGVLAIYGVANAVAGVVKLVQSKLENQK